MCTVGMDIYRIILYDYKANIAANRKAEHHNSGNEEDIFGGKTKYAKEFPSVAE